MVGLPDASVRESRDRVRSAIRNSGLRVSAAPHHRQPRAGRRAQGRRVVRPADRARHPRGPGRRRAPARSPISCCSASCRSTDRSTPTRGVLPIAAAARRDGLAGILLPAANAQRGGDRRRPRRLRRVVARPTRSARSTIRPAAGARPSPSPPAARPTAALAAPDLADVRGQLLARRALEIAAAGGHNLLLVGPPGAGKTMMARRRAGDPAAADVRRGARGDRGALGRRPAAARRGPARRAAVPRAASHDLERRARRRRIAAAARRSQPRASRRAVSRRDARVQPPRARGAAPAARGRARHDRARGAHGGLPRPLHARRRDEPVPVRIRRRSDARVPLHAAADRALSRPAVGSAARSARSDRRGAGAAARRARRRRARGESSAAVRARVVAARERQRERYAARRHRAPTRS